MAKKEKQAVWLYPEVKELLTTHMAAANAKSQSDFIEKAIRFYAGYLDCNSENMTEYLGETVSAVIDRKSIKSHRNRFYHTYSTLL